MSGRSLLSYSPPWPPAGLRVWRARSGSGCCTAGFPDSHESPRRGPETPGPGQHSPETRTHSVPILVCGAHLQPAWESHLQGAPAAEGRGELKRLGVFVHGEVQARGAPHHQHLVPVLVVQQAAQRGEARRFRGRRPLWVREDDGESREGQLEKSPRLNTSSFYSSLFPVCLRPSSFDPNVCSSGVFRPGVNTTDSYNISASRTRRQAPLSCARLRGSERGQPSSGTTGSLRTSSEDWKARNVEPQRQTTLMIDELRLFDMRVSNLPKCSERNFPFFCWEEAVAKASINYLSGIL